MADATRIEVTQSGGFTGRVRSARIDLSRLAAADVDALQRLIAAALPLLATSQRVSMAAPTGADMRQYDVVVETRDGRHEFQVEEKAVPPAVKALIARVLESARPPR